jgi:hypothetical protein
VNYPTLFPYLLNSQGREGVNWSILLTTIAGLAVVAYYFYYLLFTWGGQSAKGGIEVDVAALTPQAFQTAPADALSFAGMDSATPTPFAPATATPEPSATATLEPTQTVEAAVLPLPEVRTALQFSPAELCFNCTVYDIPVRFTHYRPWEGGINCFTFLDGYCESAMSSELRWENFIGLAAACPPEWPLGSWVEAPGIGSWVCLDRGGMVVCQDGVCVVDILARGIDELDGQIINAKVYITWK